MSFTQLLTRAQLGIQAPEVRVEVHLSQGLPAFTVVGLPETAVREARDRVRSAIINSGFEFPARRITVNLAPADLPKQGGRYDLPIALGILAASEQVELSAIEGYACFGELALGGECRGIDGLLPALIASRQARQPVLVPRQNRAEAGLVRRLPICVVDTLAGLCRDLNSGQPLPRIKPPRRPPTTPSELDLRDVYGQHQAKRALEIAAAGGHHLLMMGPPGTGKSMLARRLPTILPPLDEDQAMVSASIHSLGRHRLDPGSWRQRPFQAPHHTVSSVALAGGGSNPKPGAISLAHHGVLFLDELTEFGRSAIEVLREPLETGQIHIARAAGSAIFPACFQLVAAMNPCPGGCESLQSCLCSPQQLTRYRNKLSAPLLDRIDIQIELARLEQRELVSANRDCGSGSAELLARVTTAQRRQLERQGCLNARLDNHGMQVHCALRPELELMLASAIDRLRLSARSFHKVIRLGRTIADLAHAAEIQQPHIAEALSYRQREQRRS